MTSHPKILLSSDERISEEYEKPLKTTEENVLVKAFEKLGVLKRKVSITAQQQSRAPNRSSSVKVAIKKQSVLQQSRAPKRPVLSPNSSSTSDKVPIKKQYVLQQSRAPKRPAASPNSSSSDKVPIKKQAPEKAFEKKLYGVAKKRVALSPEPVAQKKTARKQNETETSSSPELYSSSSDSSTEASSYPSSPSPTPVPVPQVPQPVKEFVKIDPNKLKLFNALDSCHDFGKGERASVLDFELVRNIIASFLEKPVLDQFNSLKINKEFEKELYKKYVKAPANDIIEFARVPLNIGIERTGNAEDDKLEVLTDIAKYYNLEKQNIAIILDKGATAGCRKEFANKYVESYASWFDGSLTVCANKKGMLSSKNIKLTTERAVSKKANDLFYIDEIGGRYENNTYVGHIKFIDDTPRPFSENGQTKCRPGVNRYADVIKTVQDNTKTEHKWFGRQIDEIYKQSPNDPVAAVNNSCMFLMDLKRAGDGLQIETAKHTIKDKTPIFITQDYIAATISANNGIRTIFTKREGGRGTTHSMKYAHLLGHVSLQGAQTPIKEKVVRKKKEPSVTQNDIDVLLEKIIDPQNTAYITTAREFTKLCAVFNATFTEEQLNAVTNHLKKFTDYITNYIQTHTMDIMKSYLQYVLDLAAKYINEKDLRSLFGTLYINIDEIYYIIKKNDANTHAPVRGDIYLTKIQKDIVIAKYINNIFIDEYELYQDIIGSSTKTRQKELNYIIISPIGTIYMDYLLQNIDIIKEINEMIPAGYLKESDYERLVKNSKLYPIILNFVKNPNIQALRNALQDLRNRVYKSHVTYMHRIVPLPINNTETAAISGGNKSSKKLDLYAFMKLPFEEKRLMIRYSPHKEAIIKDVFDTFYKNAHFDRNELTIIKYCKTILKVPLEPIIKSSNKAFLLFRETLYFHPEYIDPFTRIYMIYSNSLLPPSIIIPSETPVRRKISFVG